MGRRSESAENRSPLNHCPVHGESSATSRTGDNPDRPLVCCDARFIMGQTDRVQIPAKADYAIRALLALAADGGSVSAEHLAQQQDLPAKFLGAVLSDLRRGGMLTSQRGPEGGFRLVRDPDMIMIADILRAVSGPLAGVRGMRPETLEYSGEATHLKEVWIAVRATLREVLEHVTLGQVLRGELPDSITRFTSDPDAWTAH